MKSYGVRLYQLYGISVSAVGVDVKVQEIETRADEGVHTPPSLARASLSPAFYEMHNRKQKITDQTE